MKKIILFISIHFVSLLGFSQSETNSNSPQNYQDTLSLAQSMINELELSKLKNILKEYKVLHSTDPSKINTDVLKMLEQRYLYFTENFLFNLELRIDGLQQMNLQSYSDSLNVVKSAIDDLGFSQIGRVLETYRFLSHTQPNLVNQDVLIYLEEKNKTFSNEN